MKSFLVITIIIAATSLNFVSPSHAGSSLNTSNQDTSMAMCPMDAMICPNGTAVGRTAPDCDFAPCSSNIPTSSTDNIDFSLIDTVIIGSAETPDPILERVEELEKEGHISNVIIMESFPVQIQLRATQEIINELNAMPRVISPSFR